jgi:2-phosphosulfolactate phosphatase
MTTQGLEWAGGVEVLTGPAQYEGLPSDYWTARVAVVFDVLRATTTMAAWLAAGAVSIQTFRTVEEARAARERNPGLILVGERGGQAPEGFDFGNSPREAVAEVGAGRHLAMSTTNGTRALVAACGARGLAAGALVNAAAVANWLRRRHAGMPLTLVLAGTGEQFALEDAVGASWVLRHLGVASAWSGLTCGGAETLEGLLRASVNGRKLAALGLGADVSWCARADVLDVVPEWVGGRLVGS